MARRKMSLVLVGTLLGLGGGVVAPAVGIGATAAHAIVPKCPPGSFDDTEGVVKVIDRTISREMSRVEKAINVLNLNPGDTVVRDRTLTNGVLVHVTFARSGDGATYSYELDMAQPGPTPTFVTITTGSRTDAGVAGGVQTATKHITMDYDARDTFVATRPTGNFVADIVSVTDPSKPAPSVQNTLDVTFDNITVRPKDPHGPRTGTYTHVGQPSIGGSLDFQASVPVPCPGTTAGPIEIAVQRRHVDDSLGERTFRRDALVTGGTLAAGEKAIKFECGTSAQSSTGSTFVLSNYILRKIENADGSTQRYTIKFKNEMAPNCNPDFGALVTPTDNSTDAPFTHPVTFPGEW